MGGWLRLGGVFAWRDRFEIGMEMVRGLGCFCGVGKENYVEIVNCCRDWVGAASIVRRVLFLW